MTRILIGLSENYVTNWAKEFRRRAPHNSAPLFPKIDIPKQIFPSVDIDQVTRRFSRNGRHG